MSYTLQKYAQSEFNSTSITHFMQQLAQNQVTRNQSLEFLNLMHDRVLDSETMVTFIDYIRQRYPYRQTSLSSVAVNIVGTGGGRPTFNISTTSAFVAAAAGAVVVKSGSNSYISRCGSLDLLKSLKINLNISFEQFENMLTDIGLCFVNPAWYAPILRRLAVTIFPETFKSVGGFVNIMGPLLAPIEVGARLIGVKSKDLIDPMAAAVHQLGLGTAIICWSDLGLDEFCAMGGNYFRRVSPDGVGPMEIDRVDASGYDRLAELEGGSPMENAAITHAILNGSIKGVKLETVLRNAAYILLLSGKVQTVEQGVSMAAEAVKSGLAVDKLEQVRRYSAR